MMVYKAIYAVLEGGRDKNKRNYVTAVLESSDSDGRAYGIDCLYIGGDWSSGWEQQGLAPGSIDYTRLFCDACYVMVLLHVHVYYYLSPIWINQIPRTLVLFDSIPVGSTNYLILSLFLK